jgi:hypothetical protein
MCPKIVHHFKGVAECGKETKGHFFFLGALPKPCLTFLSLYLPNTVCFFHTDIFSIFFGAKT